MGAINGLLMVESRKATRISTTLEKGFPHIGTRVSIHVKPA